MKKIFLLSAASGLAGLFCTGAAQAQQPLWEGSHIGLSVGVSRNVAEIQTQTLCPTVSCAYVTVPSLSSFNSAGSGTLASNSFVGSVRLGHDYQFTALVIGVEADVTKLGFSADRTVGGLIPNGTGQRYDFRVLSRADWLSTLRARAGISVLPTVLVYATGGLAVTQLQVSNQFQNTALGTAGAVWAASKSSIRTGFALGAGAEWSFTRNWSVRGEYLFASISKTVSAGQFSSALIGVQIPNTMRTQSSLNVNLLRAGVDYRF